MKNPVTPTIKTALKLSSELHCDIVFKIHKH